MYHFHTEKCKSNLTIESVLPHLERAKKTGPASWIASCPVPGHKDRNPSFSLTESGGRVLAHCHSGCDQKAVFQALQELAGHDDERSSKVIRSPQTTKDNRSEEDRRLTAWHIWQRSDRNHGVVKSYLRTRGIESELSKAVRFFRSLWHDPTRQRFPAMVAAVTHPLTGKFKAIHRTFLAKDFSGKAKVKSSKMSLAPVKAGVIKLQQADSDTLVIGEGIENALSAGQIFGYPALSTVSAGNMANIRALPDHITRVIVAADHGEVGQKCAETLAHNLSATGVHCRIESPPDPTQDWNDCLLAGGAK